VGGAVARDGAVGANCKPGLMAPRINPAPKTVLTRETTGAISPARGEASPGLRGLLMNFVPFALIFRYLYIISEEIFFSISCI
jgi:hypothetical protein